MFNYFVDDPPVQWDDVIHWFTEKMRVKSLKTSLCKLCFGAAVHHLWKQRNALCIVTLQARKRQLFPRLNGKFKLG